MMELAAVLAALRQQGRDKTRAIYRRHGADEACYGVPYAEMKALARQIKVDQALALGLWASGVHEARILATMVADPRRIASAVLDGWTADLTNGVLADALAGLAARSPHAATLTDRWRASDSEWVAAAGWNLLAHRAADSRSDLSESDCREILETIRTELPGAPNRVRHAMNGALIALGLRDDTLQSAAVAIARELGRVEVDHGATDCKTPDAEAAILKAVAQRSSKARAATRPD